MRMFNFNEITEDLVYLFTLCYDNNLNFNRLYTLYSLSSKVFWGYIGALAPILKVGAKKVNVYSDTAYNITRYLNGTPYIELSTFDKRVYNLLMMFVANIYVTGNFTHIKTQKDFEKKEVLCKYIGDKDYSTLYVNKSTDLSQVSEIKIKDTSYYKTSRLEVIINKYYGDLKMKDIESKFLRDYEDMIDDLRKEQVVTNEA